MLIPDEVQSGSVDRTYHIDPFMFHHLHQDAYDENRVDSRN